MHPEARDFSLFVKRMLNDFFIGKIVLDVGSGDINGNNRFLFENCEYNGNDVIQAKNVIQHLINSSILNVKMCKTYKYHNLYYHIYINE